jgi:choline dehydrogenase-like flavoprotein
MNADATFDVVIVGAGVCGAVCAWKLASAGHRVLALEAGEDGIDRLDLVGRFAAEGSPYKHDDPSGRAPSPDGVAKYEDYYDVAAPRTFRSGYLRRVGGSTWHFLGNVPRFLPNDFKLKSTYGRGVDWPIGYDDLEPDYCEAERLMGVSGDHEQWNGLFGAKRSQPYPMHKIWESYSDRVLTPLVEQAETDGTKIKVMSTPQARNSEPYDGRPACAGNSSCVPICPIQAKYDGTVHVAKAKAAGAELRSRAIVKSIEVDGATGRATGVRYLDWDGNEHLVAASLVVLAANAIETPKLLLASGSGLANRSDQVGRNLMDHAQGSGRCLTPEPIYTFRGPPTTSGIDVWRDGAFRSQHAAFRMSLGNDGWGRAESPAKTLASLIDPGGLFGAALKERVKDFFPRMFRISWSSEMLPDPDNRVTLSAGPHDGAGIARPHIAFQVPQYNTDAFNKAQQVLTDIFQKIGGSPAHFKFFMDWSGAGHIMGTCRMGDDPGSSVVDSNGRTHDHSNLYVVGSSVFPTAGTANPTLTAVALTLRACRSIAADLTP